MEYGTWEAIDGGIDWEDGPREYFADLGANFLRGLVLAAT